jgi:hypothetical protein
VKELKNPNFEAFGGQWSIGPYWYSSGQSPKFLNFILKMKKPKNLEFEPVHPKNVLLASVVSQTFRD